MTGYASPERFRFGWAARHASIAASAQRDARPTFVGFGKSGVRLAWLYSDWRLMPSRSAAWSDVK